MKIAVYDEQMQHELESIIGRHPKNFISCLKSKGLKRGHESRLHLVDYIMQCTSMLVDNDEFIYSLKTRVFWTINKIQDWNDMRVRCKACGKPMTKCNVKKLSSGYKKTCCKKCERKLAQKHLEEKLMQEHGVANPFLLECVINEMSMHKDEIQQKRDSTKRKNKTFKTSKKEEHAYQILCNVFSKDDIVRQYKDTRYPFNCDFYIKSHDMFIECNFSWTHGGHWFDEHCTDDIRRLEFMKSKHTKYYNNAIETWTMRDVKKRECAKKNCLNYIVFWTLDELLQFKFS